jgi:hypothetical protein
MAQPSSRPTRLCRVRAGTDLLGASLDPELIHGWLASGSVVHRAIGCPQLADSCPGCQWIVESPVIQVTVSLATLLCDSDEPAELAGYGPIPPSMARAMASDRYGTWRRILIDPAGRVVDYGRRVYRPPAHLDRFIRARDHVCTFPNCHRQAVNCELDHVRPWTDDGETNQHNLVAVCARHHHLKHDAGWTNTYNPATGATSWASPTGHTYVNTAAS